MMDMNPPPMGVPLPKKPASRREVNKLRDEFNYFRSKIEELEKRVKEIENAKKKPGRPPNEKSTDK